MDNISVTGIYAKTKKYFTTYLPTEITPLDIISNTALNTKYLALVVTEKYPKGVYIDLSHMFTEQPVGKTKTWSEFYNIITPHQIDSYKVAGSGLTKDVKQPINIHVLSAPEFNISYCDMKDPTIRDKRTSKFDLPDLVISKKTAYAKSIEDIDLNNCITSVNGIVSKSIVYKDELYITEGSKHLWDINKQTSINMFMMDTTPLGGMIKVPLSDCKLFYKTDSNLSNTNTHNVLYSDILITLPNKYNLSDYSVILCIAGKCNMPDEVTVHNYNTIRISPYLLQMELRLLELQAARAMYIPDTEVYTTEVSASEYVSTMGKSELSDIYDCIYLIKNNNLFIQREKLITELDWFSRYGSNKSGICIRSSDKSWMSYTTLEYNDLYYHFGVRWPHTTTQLTSNASPKQYGIKELNHPLVERYVRSQRDSMYEMIYITC